MIGDLVHYFCLCNSVANAWNDVKNILDILIQGNVSDFDLINLRYSKCQFEEEVIWVIGSYVHYVWRLIHVEGKHFVDRGKLFGFLKFKYRCAQLGHRTKLNIASLSSWKLSDAVKNFRSWSARARRWGNGLSWGAVIVIDLRLLRRSRR